MTEPVTHAHHHHTHEKAYTPLDRGAGKRGILFLDAFSGIAGDMLLAALLDLGVPADAIIEPLQGLGLGEFEIAISSRERSGIVARKVDVLVPDKQPARDWKTIKAMLEDAPLPNGARQRALRAFGLLARAESEVHGVPVETVHFHEVGAVDAIVDITGASLALEYLDAEVIASPLPLGRGFVNAAHGPLPVPVPATVLCLTGVPTRPAEANTELVTPTGACLVASQASRFASWPEMEVQRVGYGAGTKELPDRPNLLRAVLGRKTDEPRGSLVLLEANVDDLSGEIIAWALERLLKIGAVDAWATPIVMKKGRPATLLSALVPSEKTDVAVASFLNETTTLGVRHRPVERAIRPRKTVTVNTEYGAIDVRIAEGDGLSRNIAPEFESCRRVAEELGVPLKKVYEAALRAAQDEHPNT